MPSQASRMLGRVPPGTVFTIIGLGSVGSHAGLCLTSMGYSVIAIDTKHCPKADYDNARKFIDWIAGPDAQQLIKNFKLLNKQLFTPNAKAAM